MTLSSWLNFGPHAPPGSYNQCAVLATAGTSWFSSTADFCALQLSTLLCCAPNRRGIKLPVWRVSVAYIRPYSRTERPRKTKIGKEVAHVTQDSYTTFKVKCQSHQAALVGFTGRPTWTYSNNHLSICVNEAPVVTTCRPGWGHVVAAARLQLVIITTQKVFTCFWSLMLYARCSCV